MAGNGGFKNALNGFDKNEVNEYIGNLRKKLQEMEAEIRNGEERTRAAAQIANDADSRISAIESRSAQRVAEVEAQLKAERNNSDNLQNEIDDLKRKLRNAGNVSAASTAEAERKAAEIVERANAKARDIIEKAKQTADQIISSANAAKMSSISNSSNISNVGSGVSEEALQTFNDILRDLSKSVTDALDAAKKKASEITAVSDSKDPAPSFDFSSFSNLQDDIPITRAAAPQPAPSRTATPQPAPSRAAAPQPAPSRAAAPQPAPSRAAAPQPAPSRTVAPQPAPSRAAAMQPNPPRAAAPQPASSRAAAPQPAPSRTVAPQPAPSRAAAMQPNPPRAAATMTEPKSPFENDMFADFMAGSSDMTDLGSNKPFAYPESEPEPKRNEADEFDLSNFGNFVSEEFVADVSPLDTPDMGRAVMDDDFTSDLLAQTVPEPAFNNSTGDDMFMGFGGRDEQQFDAQPSGGSDFDMGNALGGLDAMNDLLGQMGSSFDGAGGGAATGFGVGATTDFGGGAQTDFSGGAQTDFGGYGGFGNFGASDPVDNGFADNPWADLQNQLNAMEETGNFGGGDSFPQFDNMDTPLEDPKAPDADDNSIWNFDDMGSGSPDDDMSADLFGIF